MVREHTASSRIGSTIEKPFPAHAEFAGSRLTMTCIKRHVSEGEVVIIDVTAAWCLTCKVNETIVLDREPVSTRVRSPGVVAMRADWTRPDPAITTYLQSHIHRHARNGRRVYGPGCQSAKAKLVVMMTEVRSYSRLIRWKIS